MMETELLTADEMCERLKTNFDTFRRTWKRWKHERVGMGNTLRSMRFYWQSGPVRAEANDGSLEVPDKERSALDSGRVPGRGTNRKEGFRSRREALAWEEEQKSLRTQPEDLGLRDVCTAHLLYCESRLKPNTISYKKTAYRRFIEYAGAMTLFRKIDKATIDGFVEAAAKMISKKTANKYKTELSSLWAWAGKEGYVTGNPPRQIDAYAVKKAVKYVPPAADIKSLLAVAKPGFENDFLTCLLHTAARISEIRVLA